MVAVRASQERTVGHYKADSFSIRSSSLRADISTVLRHCRSPGRVLFFRNQAKADFRYLMNIHYAGSGESLDSLEYSCMIDAATLHSTSSYGHACTTH